MSRLADVQRKWLAELARLLQAQAAEPAIDLRQESAASLPKRPAPPGLVLHMAHAAGDGDANTTSGSGGGAPKDNKPQPSPAESRRRNPPDLEHQIGQHPATDVINDILEQEEGNRPRNLEETADRVRGLTADPSRSGSRVHEVLRDNPDWGELVERLNQRQIQSRNNRHARKARGKERKAERVRQGALGGAGDDRGGKPPAQGSGGSAAGGDGRGGGKGGGGRGGGGGTAPANADSSKFDASRAEAFVLKAKELRGQSQAPKFDAEKLQKQNLKLEREGAQLSRELQATSELKDLSRSKAKDFFAGVRSKYGSVRAGAGGIVILALNVADAYALVQEVRSILDSKSLKEGLQKTFELGKNVVKGQIQFGALRFVFRSTPVAIGITVFLGDMDMNHSLGPSGEFNREIAELVNKVRPGSVDHARSHTGRTNYEDDDAQKLFMEAKAEAIRILKQSIASDLEQYGYYDGLIGKSAKTQFEVSEMEEAVLTINELWFSQHYGKGFDKASARREDLLKRARTLGKQDGRTGSRANDGSWQHWPEVKAFVGQGAPVTSLFPALQSGYDEEYERTALTAGERVQLDKQSAALKRAYELGVQDRRAGQRQHVQDIAKWPEVEATSDAAVGAARMQLLGALLSSYDRGFRALA